MFLSSFKFNKVFSKELTELYEPTGPKGSIKKLRKIRFVELPERKEGFIIGKTFKFDGVYNPGSPGLGYEDPAFLKNTKRYDMWRVAVGMNEEYLVPVKIPPADRVVMEDRVEEYINRFYGNQELFKWL